MRLFNITKGNIGPIVLQGCKIALCGLVTVLPYVSKDIVEKMRYSGNVKYSDAVNVILSSTMFSSDKNKMIELLKSDVDADYYRSIIHVVESSMYSGDKVEAIKTINKM